MVSRSDSLPRDEGMKAVFENAALGIAVVSTDGHPVISNSALQQMLGYTEDELRDMTFAEFTHPDDVNRDWTLFLELMDGRRQGYEIEKRYIRKDGRVIWGNLVVSAMPEARTNGVIGIGMVRDITERKEAEQNPAASSSQADETLREAVRLIAHDFNNLFTVIRGSCELALSDLPVNHPAYDVIREAHLASTKATALNRALFSLVKKPKGPASSG